MAKKLIPAVLLIMTFCFWSVSSTFAETVVVEGDKIFIADGGLSVLNVTDGLPADCVKDLDLVDVVGATDVVIVDGKAFVTIGDAGSVDVVIVDVSSCLLDDVDVEECFATVDFDTGKMEIPCIEVDGVVYTVRMDQRGNSMNWEVSFVGINGELLNYRRNGGGDDDDDDDGDDGDGS